jgi:hypothetical protein
MPPLMLLTILVLATVAAVIVDRARRGATACACRRLAVAHEMHYSPGDPLRVTPRVAAALPVPGAAAVRVIDLLYRTDAAGHHYVFTAEYTVGVVYLKHRVRRAAAFDEPRGATGAPTAIRVADAGLPLVAQYESLLAANGPLQ